MNLKAFLVLTIIWGQSLFAQRTEFQMVDPFEAFPLFYKAIEAADDGDFEVAKSRFKTVTSIIPLHQQALLYLKVCNDVIAKQVNLKVAEYLFNGINEFNNGEDFNQVLKSVNKAIKKNPDYFPSYIIRSSFYEGIKNYSDAYLDYSRAIDLNPQYEMIYYFRARTLINLERPGDALNDFSFGLTLNPEYVPSLIGRGFIYSDMGRLDEAYVDLKKAMILNAAYTREFKLVEIFNRIGIKFLNDNNTEKSIESFNFAIVIGKQWNEPYLNRGIAYRELEEYELAMTDFNNAIKYDTTSASAYYNRGLTHRDLGDLEEAESDFLKSTFWDSENPKYYNTLGQLYFKNRKNEKAIFAFKKVLQYDEYDIWANYWIAFAYDRKKEFNMARNYYRQFISIVPEEHDNFKKRAENRVQKISRWLSANSDLN